MDEEQEASLPAAIALEKVRREEHRRITQGVQGSMPVFVMNF